MCCICCMYVRTTICMVYGALVSLLLRLLLFVIGEYVYACMYGVFLFDGLFLGFFLFKLLANTQHSYVDFVMRFVLA